MNDLGFRSIDIYFEHVAVEQLHLIRSFKSHCEQHPSESLFNFVYDLNLSLNA